jgi:hypothetical protein
MLFVVIFIVALWNVRFGKYNLTLSLSKFTIFLFCIFTIYIYYISVNSIDSSNYKLKFELIDSLTVNSDLLFAVFIKFLKLFNNDYQLFRGIIGCIYLIPILIIIKIEGMNTFNVPLFLLFCLIFPYFQSIVALRFTMASSIAVIAFYLFFKSKKTTKAIIATLITLVITSFIHDTCILYVALFLLFIMYKKIKNKQMMTGILISLDILFILLLRFGSISSFLFKLVGDTNTFYFSIMNTYGMGFFITIFLQCGYIFLLYKTMRKKTANNSGDELREDIMLLNYCSLIFIPMYSVNTFSFRLFRGLLLLDFLLISQNYKIKKFNLDLALFIALEVVCMLFDANGLGSIISIIGGG